MRNYEYIIASLPVLSLDSPHEDVDTDAVIEEIKSQCSEEDCRLIDFLLDGYDGERLGRDFYIEAFRSPSRFIREYFAFDLKARNSKVRFLNRSLDRPAKQDLVFISEDEELEDVPEIDAAYAQRDILARERAVDEMMWGEADRLVEMEVFSIDVILAFIAKLQIIGRWLKLDEQTGREMFRKLVNEVRGTFEGVSFEQ